MDKYEERRLDLLRLVEQMGRGGRVRVANAISKSPDYIARMLYPKGKNGHKGIGEDTAELIDKAFPNWRMKNIQQQGQPLRVAHSVNEASPPDYHSAAWPFKTVTPRDWASIPPDVQAVIEQQVKAMATSIAENERAA